PVTAFPGVNPVACGTGSPLTVAGAAADLGSYVPHRIPCYSFARKRPSISCIRGVAEVFVNAQGLSAEPLAPQRDLRENCANHLITPGGMNGLRSPRIHRRLPHLA